MIKGTYTADDLVSAQWLHVRPRRSLRVVGILLAAVLCLAGVVMFIGPSGSDWPWGKWLYLASLAYFPILFAVGMPYRTRRSFRQRKDLHRECSFAASDDGLRVQSGDIQGLKPWSDYLKWKEGDDAFLLYMSDNMYQVVPRRFFDSASDVDTFRALLEKNVRRAKS
jgi:hypothetical protein